MSRSFKNTPVYKDGSDQSKKRRYWKRQENKKVRKCRAVLGKSNEYRKIGKQWNICDYRFYETKPADAAAEDLDWWKKFYFRK